MPPKIDQGAILILDVGKNTAPIEEKGVKSFFDQAQECAARIIERKIMSQAKHHFGIILLGSKGSKNPKADECRGAFKHVEIQAELQAPTWKMIRDLPKTPSKSRGDWMDALIVAADHFINGVSDVKINNRKIILITNFLSPTELEENDIEQVINGFKVEKIQVDVIGPDIYDESLKIADIDIACKLIEETDGATAPFDYAMRYLLFHKKRAVNIVSWNADLSIGPNIKIPVSSYIRLKDEPAVKSWMKAVKDPVTLTASSTEGIMSHKMHVNSENQEVVDTDSVIKGYHYGQQIIPFSDTDKLLLYESGERSLSMYGFTHASNVNWQNLKGDGISYVFGRKGDKKAQLAIKCLTECLHEMNLVGIGRRVYNKGNQPKMYAIMPVIDNNNYICLSMVEICYKDDIKYMAFPSTNLKRYACSDEQVNAFKDLIKAMDLTNAYDDSFDDTEAFPIAETVSPSVQYVIDCIAFRAMNPGKPLPEPREDIMTLFNVPPLIEKRSKDPLEKLKKLFTLNKVETKIREKKNQPENDSIVNPTASNTEDNIKVAEMPTIQLPPAKAKSTLKKISTIDPVNDFKALVEQGKSLKELSEEFAEAIEHLTLYNLDGTYSKAITAMAFYRMECVKSEPNIYNNWLQKFKLALNDRKKQTILNLINENNLNFILKTENNSSSYENVDSHNSQLYENDTVPEPTELTINSELNNLFDEM